jgi:hypothetical protein
VKHYKEHSNPPGRPPSWLSEKGTGTVGLEGPEGAPHNGTRPLFALPLLWLRVGGLTLGKPGENLIR